MVVEVDVVGIGELDWGDLRGARNQIKAAPKRFTRTYVWPNRSPRRHVQSA